MSVVQADDGPCLLNRLEEPLLRTTSMQCAQQQSSDVTSSSSNLNCSWWDHVCLLMVLPLLLCLQFCMALRYSSDVNNTLSARDVGFAIVIFVGVSYLYKQCLHANPHKSFAYAPLILLLPEIMVDVVLGTVLFVSVDMGWTLLLWCALGLSMFVIASTLWYLCGETSHRAECQDVSKLHREDNNNSSVNII